MSRTVYYPDAGSMEHLSRMVQAEQERAAATDPKRREGEGRDWVLPTSARIVGNSVEPGALVEDIGDGAVRAADAALGRPASGVVVRMLGAGRCLWSPLARVEVFLPSFAPQTFTDIYLGRFGGAMAEEPGARAGRLALDATGWISQAIGRRIGSRNETGRVLCLIVPGVPNTL
jgi:hypothetical protein